MNKGRVAGETRSLVARYLDLLDIDERDVAAGSAGTLTRVHRAHAVRFCHDTIWMSRHRVPAVRYEALVTALLDGEGGACVNLNASLAWLLRQLGYVVELHRARVVQGFEDQPSDLDAHLVLHVQTTQGQWLADVGLGAGLLEPVPLVPGRYQQGDYAFVLDESDEPGLSYRLQVDRRLLGVRQIELESGVTELPALRDGYAAYCNHTSSPYVRHLTAHIRTDDGSVMLNGRVLARVVNRRRTTEVIEHAGRWEEVLREVFRLSLPGLTAAERDVLWDKTGAAG